MILRSMLLAAALIAVSTVARAASVEVRVSGVTSNVGTIRVGVCTRAEFLKPTCRHVGHAPAQRGTVTVIVEGVPDGVYAVQAHHDTNGDGRIDMSFFGRPTEGIGFSRDAPFRFGPPRFADAALSIGGALVAVDITLKFEP